MVINAKETGKKLDRTQLYIIYIHIDTYIVIVMTIILSSVTMIVDIDPYMG